MVDVKVLLDLARYGERPVSELDAKRLANRLGARTYVESSALTQRNLKQVKMFEQVLNFLQVLSRLPGRVTSS